MGTIVGTMVRLVQQLSRLARSVFEYRGRAWFLHSRPDLQGFDINSSK